MAGLVCPSHEPYPWGQDDCKVDFLNRQGRQGRQERKELGGKNTVFYTLFLGALGVLGGFF